MSRLLRTAALLLALPLLVRAADPAPGPAAAPGPTALVVIDVQNDYFPGGAYALEAPEAAAQRTAALLARFRQAGALVVHVRHENGPEAPFMVAGSRGAEIHPAVAPAAGEPVLVKHVPSSFADTGLRALLDRAGVRRLVLAGMQTNVCVRATALEARELGYAVEVARDATAARDAARFEAGLADAAKAGARVVTTDAVLAGPLAAAR